MKAADSTELGAIPHAGGDQLAMARRHLTSAEGEEVNLAWSTVRRVRARQATLDKGAALVLLGRDVRLARSASVLSMAGKIEITQGFGQWLIGGIVHAKQVFAVAVIAGKVEGPVRCLFDTKGAFAFGAGLAVMSSILRLFLGRR